VFSLLISYLLLYLQSKTSNSQDSILGILSHSSLAIGIVIISMASRRIDVKSYLFGNIITVTEVEIAIIYSCLLVTSSLFFFLWRSIISTIIHPELAIIDGINTKKIDLLITLTTALVIACNIKSIGVLLVTAMLIIPAATSQIFATSPLQMVCFAAIFGFMSIISGLVFCWYMDTPAGPSIVVCSFIVFLLAKIFKNILNLRDNKA
jgi:zinc transport system permease protein